MSREGWFTMKTNRDIHVTDWPSAMAPALRTPFTVPTGTRVIYVQGNGGGYAVADTRLIEQLTGNTHDPTYRYVWIPEDAVDKEQTQ